MAYSFTDGRTETDRSSDMSMQIVRDIYPDSLPAKLPDASTKPHVIGPNSVTQLEHACDQILGREQTVYLFTAAGFYKYIQMPPIKMVPEDHPAKLFDMLYRIYPKDVADRVAKLAGVLTADYVIANRIPGFASKLLRWVPAKLAGSGLLKAIQKNSWTFAGSGICQAGTEVEPHVNITDNPLRMPGAAWHVGVFERMFRRLVCAHATVDYSCNGAVSAFDIKYGLSRMKSGCPLAKAGEAPPMCVNCTQSTALGT